ncbi:hypothetical protein SAMN05421781_2518 [Marinococcus luteus]|uniref:Uncharacterized protein n=1 Tax=Marinococcus luteus TaxID=1122204 RepID=A0A1H2WVK3_9BACI|nr:hypothetical protein [Marinococcus luteus]SDW84693.1 hypothetical protein SAMN05421781_2518 [Marinococcus luteus]
MILLLMLSFKAVLAFVAAVNILLEAFTPQPLLTGWMTGIHVWSLLYLLYFSLHKNFDVEEGNEPNGSYRWILPARKRKEKVADIENKKRKKKLS